MKYYFYRTCSTTPVFSPFSLDDCGNCSFHLRTDFPIGRNFHHAFFSP